MLLDDLAEVFFRAESRRQVELFWIDDAVGQRDALRSQIAVDACVGGVVPSLPLGTVLTDHRLAAPVMAFEQVVEFVQDDSGGLFVANLRKHRFVEVQPPVLVHGQPTTSFSRTLLAVTWMSCS